MLKWDISVINISLKLALKTPLEIENAVEHLIPLFRIVFVVLLLLHHVALSRLSCHSYAYAYVMPMTPYNNRIYLIMNFTSKN